MTRLTIRIDFGNGTSLGPGKVRLLELVEETGSIRRSAAAMKMSYRRAWLLLDALKVGFGAPVVETSTGGRTGGGARLTPLGRFVVARYRALEMASTTAVTAQISALARRLAPRSPAKPTRRRPISR